jgi:hypothetical protein
MQSVAQGTAGVPSGPWTAAQIHDTVAKIAAQPMYAPSARQSLLGRLFRFLIEQIKNVFLWFRGSADARLILILVAILVAAIIVARVVVERRLADQRRRGLGIRARQGERVDYWALARDEAAAGRYAEGCHAVYAAVLDTFAREGLVTFHASKTSGDYDRELRRAGSAVRADFRSFARQFDRAVFGEVSVSADDYVRVRESGERAVRVRMAA